MTSLRAAAVAARDRLRAAAIDEPEIEAELLLRYALEVTGARRPLTPTRPSTGSGRTDQAHRGSAVTRVELYTRFEEELPPETAAVYESFLGRRLAHEPSAYVMGRREFWGLEFLVTPAVLIPRPETEGLIEAVVREVGTRSPTGRLRIADIGTGSGAIAVALAKELPWAEVYASDVSREALAVAAENARRRGVEGRIAVRCGQLLTPVHDYVDYIVANLPYVTTAEWSRLEPELQEHEPRLALDGGEDGLDLIRELLRQATRYLRPEGCVALEIGKGQTEALGRFVEGSISGAAWRVERDLSGKPRVFLVRAGR